MLGPTVDDTPVHFTLQTHDDTCRLIIIFQAALGLYHLYGSTRDHCLTLLPLHSDAFLPADKLYEC